MEQQDVLVGPGHKFVFSWQAPDFEHEERDASWYGWSIFAASALVLLALFVQKNILFALFIIIAEAMLIFLSWQKPRERLYSLTPDGIFAEQDQLATYDELHSFAIVGVSGKYAEIVLRFKKSHRPYLKMLIPSSHAQQTRELLATGIPEFEYQMNLVEAMVRRFRL